MTTQRREKKPATRKNISVRLPPQLLDEIDQALEDARQRQAPCPVDRTDLIERALEAVLKFSKQNNGLLPLSYELFPDLPAVANTMNLATATARARANVIRRLVKEQPAETPSLFLSPAQKLPAPPARRRPPV